MYDFLLVHNNNLPYLASLLRYSDLIAKIAHFSHPLLFSGLVHAENVERWLSKSIFSDLGAIRY